MHTLSSHRISSSCRQILAGLALLCALGLPVHAGSRLLNPGGGGQGGGDSSGSSANGGGTSQTATPATTAVAQAAQTSALAKRAQAALLRSTQALQAQQNAQNTAHNIAISGPNNLGTTTVPLVNVPDGLAPNGLVPGIAGVDAADPRTVAVPTTVTTNGNGTSTVVIVAGTAITLPADVTTSQQITVTSTGAVGTIGTVTTGGTIKNITAGVATTIAPGSTISLPNGGQLTFASGSAPTTVNTYNYGTSGKGVPDSWTGVGGLSQATYAPGAGQTTGQTTVTVTQTQQQALLTWQTFNIGKHTVLDFDQSAGGADVGNWVAINKIATGIAPSQILGSIQAPGQVYVLNQNGIIFGGSSQVNTHALVASSLPINDGLVNRGLLNNPDFQFLFSQLNISSGTQGPTPAFTPPAAPTTGNIVAQDANGNMQILGASGIDGDVIVQAGAQLNSPTTPEHVGGKVALVGPNVSNAGTISSPDGQVILAAGLQAAFSASSDPSLRGLNVTIGRVSDPTYGSGLLTGTVTNTGDIEIPRADAMFVGRTINQNGIINSSTSVALNGRVDLLANYGGTVFLNGINGFNGTTGLYNTASGAVNFGAGSVTQVLPELSSTETVVGASLALPSQVNVQGKTIYMANDSLLLAPSAQVNFNAGTWLAIPDGSYNFFNSLGQVYLDQGATIDVSGSENVAASVTDNIIEVQLLGAQLANSPLQQNGALRGATVSVDIRQTGTYNGTNWIGTPIGDVAGYANLIDHTVGQLTTAGGSVNISAGGSVVLQKGSSVNVSGGWTNYQGGNVETTKVVSGGQIYDISQATPNRVYQGIYTGFTSTSQKWGVTQNSANALLNVSHYEAGYIQGGNGGSLTIKAPSMALDGALVGNTVSGAHQITPAAQLAKTYAGATFLPTTLAVAGMPTASSLTIAFEGANPGVANFPTYSPTPPHITFQNGVSGQLAADAFSVDANGDPAALRSDRVTDVILSPDLVNTNGFGNFTLTNKDGDITVPVGVVINTPAGGSVTSSGTLAGGSLAFSAANLTINGSLTTAGGSLLFNVSDFSPYTVLADGAPTPNPDPTRGNFVLGSGATLSTAGLIFNATDGNTPTLINGGSIAIHSYNADLQAGSLVNASGGAVVNANGSVTYGTGGSIAISAGQDLKYPALLGGTINLGSTLQAFSGTTGGSLSITAPLIQIGGSALQNGDDASSGNTVWLNRTNPDGTLAGPDFFNQGGFASFNFTGLGKTASGGGFMPAVLVAPGTTIKPVVQSWVAQVGNGTTTLASTTLPLASQRNPASLTFNAPGVTDSQNNSQLVIRGDIVFGTGSSIITDPQTNATKGVTIKGQTAAILGSIIAPGGTISITGGSTFANANNTPLLEATVDIGPQAYLSTKGTVLTTVNSLGVSTGTVLNGGTISISGNIVAEAGSILDVSGSSGTLYVHPGQAAQTATLTQTLVPLRQDSNGGSIKLNGSQFLFTDATLRGAAGGPGARGGSLSVSSGIFLGDSSFVQTPLDASLIVTQTGLTIPVPNYYGPNGTAIGTAVVDGNGNTIAGRGYFSVGSFENSGFDSLTLSGTVQFKGPIDLSANSSLIIANNPLAANGGVIYADSLVKLSAAYIAIGQTFISPAAQQSLPSPYTDSKANLFTVPPVFGAGNLQVSAGLIDVGNLSLQNIGQVSLTAVSGDIRGNGTLEVAGDMTLTAGQIYPTTESKFTLAAFDHGGTAGSITIHGSGSRRLPLSAGGTLNVYASTITQGGVLRAPMGTINLGSGVTTASPLDSVSGQQFTPTQHLTLASGSETSVSAVDPITGEALIIPYGVNVNGVQWNDPAGNNITTAGNGPGAIPAKSITVSGANVDDQAGSVVDVSGGGDIYSYQFVTGTGGTVDFLNQSNQSYAILPSSYSATGKATTYAPSYANDGYSSSDTSVAVGQQIYLSGGGGLKAGYYTLLPSIYALQPNAYLVTAKSGIVATSKPQSQSDGSTIVSGYMVNGLNPSTGQQMLSSFEVAAPTVVKTRGQYDIFTGTSYLANAAAAANAAKPRLPIDAGQLVLAAQTTLNINGSVRSLVPTGGLGSLVDITSPNDILIAGTNADLSGVSSSTLVLSASGLSGFGADSLLIGGYRGANTTAGTPVTVTTSHLTVDNAGDGNALSGPDVILVSNNTLTLKDNSQVTQGTRTLASPVQTLVLGNSSVAGSGNGTLVRVSSDATAQISRLGVNSAGSASLYIGSGAVLSGASLTLDSTNQSTLLSSALTGTAVNINSGLISLVLDTGSSTPSPSGLVLSNAALQNLQASAQALALLSYSSIDIYGSGSIGGAPDSTGKFPVESFALHAGAIRGDGGNVTINAKSVSLDNSASAVESGVAPVAASGGSFTLNAQKVSLGSAGQTAVNGMTIKGYDTVTFDASSGIMLQSAGSTTSSTGTISRGAFTLSTSGSAPNTGNLVLKAPVITGATAANQTIQAGGILTVGPATAPTTTPVTGGLGATLNLVGQSVNIDSNISLASGTLNVEATTGNVVIGGQGASVLDASGIKKTFNGKSEYTSGGRVTLTSDNGSVNLASGGTVNVSAPTDGGNAGTLTVNSTKGDFALTGNVKGAAGTGGQGGNFVLDTATVNASSTLGGNDLTPLETALNTGGFNQSQNIRVRGGMVGGTTYKDVYLQGTTAATRANAWNYNLSADSGSIIVSGGINASGVTGGSINLTANGSVVLQSGAVLSVAGQNFNDAGKGGSVTLSAGSAVNGVAPVSVQPRDSTTKRYADGTSVVDIQNGSSIDLSVVNNTGTASKTVQLTSSGSSYISLPQATSLVLPKGTPGNDVLTFTTAGTVTSGGVTTSFNAGDSLSGLAPGATIQLSAPGAVLFAGGSTGAAVPVTIAANVNYTQGSLDSLTGTVHIRAPRLANGTDLQVDPINGTILNASRIELEGYKIYTPAGGNITTAVEGTTASAANNGTVFGDAKGFTANTTSILTSLLGSAPTPAQQALYQVTPGAELINTTGDLNLNTTWDLSTFRFGPNNVAGELTLRAAGNLVFKYAANNSASLSDGFTGYAGNTTSLWQATIMSGPSWSYNLVAGSDFGSADTSKAQSLAYLTSHSLGGSIRLGPLAPALPTGTQQTATIVPRYYQVIRTGTGDINITAGGDVLLLNPLGTIYTAGAQADALANFALPSLDYQSTGLGSNPSPVYEAAYSQSGGNVSITAGRDLGHYLMDSVGNLTPDASREMPTSWLYRQGFVLNGQFTNTNAAGPVAGTSWWIDFHNYFEGVGALGGGNVALIAGRNVFNVDAAVPTNARMPGTTPAATALLELGGGDLLVQAGNDISGGVYYVERGDGTLRASGSIHSNSNRSTISLSSAQALGSSPSNSTTWLPTTLFLGKGGFDISAGGSALLGPMVNPFLLPQALYNSFLNKTYFSTYDVSDSVEISSLTGDVTLKNNIVKVNGSYYEGTGSLLNWYANVYLSRNSGTYTAAMPWQALVETNVSPFDPAAALMPPTLLATSFSGDINVVGGLTLSPSPTGTLELLAAADLNGYQPNAVTNSAAAASAANPVNWGFGTINLSDADPSSIPSIVSPLSFSARASGFQNTTWASTVASVFTSFAALFDETGATNGSLQQKQARHASGLLHDGDPNPVRLYAESGDISGINLYSGKFAQVVAGRDITDVSLYVQNSNATDITLVQAGRDIITYDPASALRQASQVNGNRYFGQNATFSNGQSIGAPTFGDIQISGQGTLEVLAGRNLSLGVGPSNNNGTSVGITSIGNQRNPYLPFTGADVVTGAGINGNPDYAAFEAEFLVPGTPESARYLSDLAALMNLSGLTNEQVWTAFQQLPVDQQNVLAIDVFYHILRDTGRDHNQPGNDGTGNYNAGMNAIAALFPGNGWKGDVSLTSREIKTENGGDISILVPGGSLTVGFDVSGNQAVDQGVLTVDGGNINIFTDGDVNVGTSRIFTLSGGNEILWSTHGDIAAGSSSKTIQSAPPTRVVVDPQSGNVKTDLAGLATGGGIGVLDTVVGAGAADVDLIAPSGTVNAGDAGIRASGNLNIAAVQVLNAGNISVGGSSSGVPAGASAPNIAGLSAASSATGAANNTASELAKQQQNRAEQTANNQSFTSIITVEVIGYGG